MRAFRPSPLPASRSRPTSGLQRKSFAVTRAHPPATRAVARKQRRASAIVKTNSSRRLPYLSPCPSPLDTSSWFRPSSPLSFLPGKRSFGRPPYGIKSIKHGADRVGALEVSGTSVSLWTTGSTTAAMSPPRGRARATTTNTGRCCFQVIPRPPLFLGVPVVHAVYIVVYIVLPQTSHVFLRGCCVCMLHDTACQVSLDVVLFRHCCLLLCCCLNCLFRVSVPLGLACGTLVEVASCMSVFESARRRRYSPVRKVVTDYVCTRREHGC